MVRYLKWKDTILIIEGTAFGIKSYDWECFQYCNTFEFNPIQCRYLFLNADIFIWN